MSHKTMNKPERHSVIKLKSDGTYSEFYKTGPDVFVPRSSLQM